MAILVDALKWIRISSLVSSSPSRHCVSYTLISIESLPSLVSWSGAIEVRSPLANCCFPLVGSIAR